MQNTHNGYNPDLTDGDQVSRLMRVTDARERVHPRGGADRDTGFSSDLTGAAGSGRMINAPVSG